MGFPKGSNFNNTGKSRRRFVDRENSRRFFLGWVRIEIWTAGEERRRRSGEEPGLVDPRMDLEVREDAMMRIEAEERRMRERERERKVKKEELVRGWGWWLMPSRKYYNGLFLWSSSLCKSNPPPTNTTPDDMNQTTQTH